MRALQVGEKVALLAQLVEHFIRNEGVICSNQIEGTSFQRREGHLIQVAFLLRANSRQRSIQSRSIGYRR
jgi:hypothetical protein